MHFQCVYHFYWLLKSQKNPLPRHKIIRQRCEPQNYIREELSFWGFRLAILFWMGTFAMHPTKPIPLEGRYPTVGHLKKISSCLLLALNWSRMKSALNCYLPDFFVPKCNYSQEVAGIFFLTNQLSAFRVRLTFHCARGLPP